VNLKGKGSGAEWNPTVSNRELVPVIINLKTMKPNN
jgi:hypothetical protein